MNPVPAKSDDNSHAQDSKPKYWGPFASTIWVVLIFLVPQVIAGLLIQFLPGARHLQGDQLNDWMNNNIPVQFGFTLVVEAMALTIVWLVVKHYRGSRRTIGLLKPRWVDALIAACGFAAYFLAYIVLIAVLQVVIPSLNLSQQQDIGFQNVTTGGSLILAFLSLVVIPPIAEEIIFRGFVYTGFRRKFGFVVATLATSVLFAIPHLLEAKSGGPLWVAGIDTFVLSFILCFLREKTGRLVPGMGVHALKNMVAFSYLFIFHIH